MKLKMEGTEFAIWTTFFVDILEPRTGINVRFLPETRLENYRSNRVPMQYVRPHQCYIQYLLSTYAETLSTMEYADAANTLCSDGNVPLVKYPVQFQTNLNRHIVQIFHQTSKKRNQHIQFVWRIFLQYDH